MNAPPPVIYAADDDGVGWLVVDDTGSRANVFSVEMQDALSAAITQAERDVHLKAAVVISGKERIFIAGADLKVVAGFPDADTATDFSRRGQRLFQRLADFRVPVVCGVHGACVGGGFELALACHWRVASDADVTQIGLPETSIGTIPGWGGSVRLPRLIGVKPALDHILKAQLVTAAEAFAAGLVNEVAPTADLRARAKSAALKLAAEGKPPKSIPPAGVPELFGALRQSVETKTRGHQPALLAAIDVVELTSEKPEAEALEIEARIFGEVTASATCKNLIRVFFLRDAAKKRTLDGWFERGTDVEGTQPRSISQEEPGQRSNLPPVRRVGVIGAGVMGSGIAQWLAVHGFDVVLRDVQPDILDRGLDVARRLFDEAVKRRKITAGEANAGLRRIATTTKWDGFQACELVIEAIVENARAKQSLFAEIAAVVPPTTILASNTSALPIEEIAGHVPYPERTLGIHFFNPVSRMPLVELIIGRQTSLKNAQRALTFVKALGKTPVVCRSSPGFLVTRVLFFYLNEAVRLREAGTITEEIDAVLCDFGWPMGPLRLIDEVGVDVTDFVFREMEAYFPQRFTRATTCERMVANNFLGRKNGTSRGFYRYEHGMETVNDDVLVLLPTRPSIGTELDARARDRREIAELLMRVMVDEAKRCLGEGVVKSEDDVDFALLSGAGFPAFRGGLMHWARESGVP